MSEHDTPGRADEALTAYHELEAHAAIFPRNNDGRVADGRIVCVALGRAIDRYGIWIAGWRDHLRRALCHWPDHGPLQFVSCGGRRSRTRRSGLNSARIHGTHVLVEEPSTASTTDSTLAD